jgi:hypothetical protein
VVAVWRACRFARSTPVQQPQTVQFPHDR